MATKEKWAKTFHTWHRYKDDIPIYFGDDNDASISWDSSNATLDVTGATQFTGEVLVTGGVTWSGAINTDDTTNATSATTGSMQTDGGLGVVRDIFVGGAVAISTTLLVAGTITGNGNAGFGGALNVGGTITGNGNAVVGGGLNVGSTSHFAGDLTTGGALGVGNTLLVNNATTLSSTLAVTGIATFTANLVPAVTDTVSLGTNLLNFSDLFLDLEAVINFDSGDVTITHAANLLTMAGGNLRMGTTDKVEFRSADQYIHSLSTDALRIYSGGSGDTAILLSGNTRIAGYFLLYQTDTDGTSGGQMWFDTSEQKIKHQCYPAKVITLADVTRAQTFLDNITLTSDKKIQFADSGMYIHQLSANCLRIVSDGVGDNAVLISANTRIAGYLKLYEVSAAGTTQGQIWFDTDDSKVHYYASAEITLADVTTAQTFLENVTLDSDKKLCFEDSGSYIHKYTDNCLRIVSDGIGESAILLSGNVRIAGYLNLYSTDTDGTVEGQLWYDDSEDKLKYRVTLAKTITVADVTRAQTFLENIEMTDDKRISFGGSGKYIHELSANCLRIVSDGSGDSAILVSADTRFAGFLLLYDTASEGTTNGQIWYDSADNKFHGRAAGATVTFDVT